MIHKTNKYPDGVIVETRPAGESASNSTCIIRQMSEAEKMKYGIIASKKTGCRYCKKEGDDRNIMGVSSHE